GEGGMVLTDREDIAVRARVYGNHGRQRDQGGLAISVGHNYRMSEFHAALGLWALERLGEAIDRRKRAARRYDDALRSMEGVTIILEPGRAEWNRQSYPVRIQGERRERIANELRKKGIETSPGPLPAHIHPYIVASLHPPRLSETESAYEGTLLLPMYAALTENDQSQVIGALQNALASCR
ncbi:MAG TPA: DegT/DnrJ/EryC1/StrS family aminotransferase, partial [Bdellovibrionota bacterium]|nr:DegT/DnrJ/EryC1/StrS family aminotransferase [Bdellovibrionota bacterium]